MVLSLLGLIATMAVLILNIDMPSMATMGLMAYAMLLMLVAIAIVVSRVRMRL